MIQGVVCVIKDSAFGQSEGLCKDTARYWLKATRELFQLSETDHTVSIKFVLFFDFLDMPEDPQRQTPVI